MISIEEYSAGASESHSDAVRLKRLLVDRTMNKVIDGIDAMMVRHADFLAGELVNGPQPVDIERLAVALLQRDWKHGAGATERSHDHGSQAECRGSVASPAGKRRP